MRLKVINDDNLHVFYIDDGFCICMVHYTPLSPTNEIRAGILE